MKVVAIVTGIQGPSIVEFKEQDGSKTKHKCVTVWAKSAEEDVQGKWVTIVNLYDEKIAEAVERGLAVNSMISIDVRPSFHKTLTEYHFPAVTTKLISIL